MMNQRTATVNTLVAVLKERGVNYELNGKTPVSEVLTDKDKADVKAALIAMFRGGQVDMTEEAKVKYQDDKELAHYVGGLINNWVRKAPEFNNGGKYVPKNPGSRTGSSDDQIKEMKKLLSVTTDPQAKAKIQEAIEARQAEIKPKIEINKANLPDSLKHLA